MSTATLPLKTTAAARLLGVPYWRLFALVRDGLVTPPKDSSGDYVWTDSDIERAREALARRRGNAHGAESE